LRFEQGMAVLNLHVDTTPETAENVAAEYVISRADRGAYAPRSQQSAAAAQPRVYWQSKNIAPLTFAARGGSVFVDPDEYLCWTTLDELARPPG
jgi:acetyl-CoA acetyltransferase